MAEDIVTQEAAERATDDEFKVGFLQGYVDLKRRVALDHPNWNLSGYRGAEFDYWADEAPKEVRDSYLPANTQEEVGRTEDTPVDDPAA